PIPVQFRPPGIPPAPPGVVAPRGPWDIPAQPGPPDGSYCWGYQAPPLPPPPAPRRGRWPIWLALGVVAVLLLCVAPAAFVVSRLPLGADAVQAGGSRSDGRGPAPSPRADAPLHDRIPWVRERITEALDAQSAALLGGNLRKFLSPVDAKATTLPGELTRRYGSLRELRTVKYTQEIVRGPSPASRSGGRQEWSARVAVGYCFVAADCVPDSVFVDTTWVETASGPRLLRYGASAEDGNGPRPWEISNLRALAGKRTVVAATEAHASRLPALLREAEKAAANADKFVLPGGSPPDRYRIFLAGPAEWKRWYGGGLPAWAVGFAKPVGERRLEVVLNVSKIEDGFLDELLRHELGHVVTLNSRNIRYDGNFWLIEGMAEYIQENGRPLATYDGRTVVRRYLNQTRWNGQVNVGPPTQGTPEWQVGAKYGISYYAVRRIAERFGRAKLMAFYSAVVLEPGGGLDASARRVLGVSWSNVNNDCARYLRRAVG
ncbi:MAG TPA: hypothetical protein VNV66_17885, partial [Pilimelia sp.]|nr:hypothetical protein [Pilimelia sp.]